VSSIDENSEWSHSSIASSDIANMRDVQDPAEGRYRQDMEVEPTIDENTPWSGADARSDAGSESSHSSAAEAPRRVREYEDDRVMRRQAKASAAAAASSSSGAGSGGGASSSWDYRSHGNYRRISRHYNRAGERAGVSYPGQFTAIFFFKCFRAAPIQGQ
jgi:hypothetical protein